MSIRDLPHEVLNLVFSQIHDKTSAPTAESQATFSSLCLTSKSLLPLAREYLYYRPLRSRTNVLSWENFLGLLLILQQPHSPLTPLVRSLEELPPVFDSFGFADGPDLPLIAKYGGSHKYFYRLLEICSNLSTLEIVLRDSDQVANVTRSLQVSTPTIKTLHLRNCRQPVVQEALDHPLFQHIETLVVTNSDLSLRSAAVTPRTKLPLKSLRFHRDDLNIEFLKSFMPEDPSSLVDFALSFDQKQLSDISLSAILNLLPSTLRRLSVQFKVIPKSRSISFPASLPFEPSSSTDSKALRLPFCKLSPPLLPCYKASTFPSLIGSHLLEPLSSLPNPSSLRLRSTTLSVPLKTYDTFTLVIFRILAGRIMRS
ncbi:hypothetical protein JCM5353_008832 [Sporobolomyces roseus]